VGQGKRSDIDKFKTWVGEQTTRPSERIIAREFPGLFLRYPRLTGLLEHLLPHPDIQSGEFREWQSVLDSKLKAPPNDRTVEFIIDPEGAQGKSWFVRYYVSKYPDQTQFLSVGKRDDLAFAIDESKSIFLFDVPRGQLEFFQYSVLEKLKDQLVFSSKYASRIKVIPQPVHVVVFTNEHPDRSKMTPDRYVETLLTNPQPTFNLA
jgi:hypothetical protein